MFLYSIEIGFKIKRFYIDFVRLVCYTMHTIRITWIVELWWLRSTSEFGLWIILFNTRWDECSELLYRVVCLRYNWIHLTCFIRTCRDFRHFEFLNEVHLCQLILTPFFYFFEIWALMTDRCDFCIDNAVLDLKPFYAILKIISHFACSWIELNSIYLFNYIGKLYHKFHCAEC